MYIRRRWFSSGNVFHWDADIQSEVELGFGFVRGGLALHLADRAVEHLSVELEADGLDMSALLSAQQIARSAQFEIEGRNFEAGAQVGKFFQRSQAPARDWSQLDFAGSSR